MENLLSIVTQTMTRNDEEESLLKRQRIDRGKTVFPALKGKAREKIRIGGDGVPGFESKFTVL